MQHLLSAFWEPNTRYCGSSTGIIKCALGTVKQNNCKERFLKGENSLFSKMEPAQEITLVSKQIWNEITLILFLFLSKPKDKMLVW